MTDNLSPDQIAQDKKLAEEATAGPWRLDPDGPDVLSGDFVIEGNGDREQLGEIGEKG